MRIIIIPILLSNFLFPVGGVIVFNDGTTIEGDVSNVNESSIYITPMGLTFPEQIRMENVDSLKLDDGKLLVANNRALLLFDNGQFYEPVLGQSEEDEIDEEYDVEYVLAPNWSVNTYLGYPLIKSKSLSDRYYDKVSPVFGLSIGATLLYMFANYFLKGFVEEKFSSRFSNLTEKFKKNEFIFFLIYRFIGGIPFFISNILPTIFNVKVRNFFLGSIIGMTPQLFVGASLGAGLSKILKENSELPSVFELIFSPDIYLPILGIVILVLIGLLLKKKFYVE